MAENSSPNRASLARALRLATVGGRGWLSAHISIVVLQGLLPLIGIYLMKLIVDTIADGIGSDDPGAAYDGLLVVIALAAGVALVGAAARVVGSVVAEAHGRAVSDRVADQLHAQSVRIDLAYYENPEYHDTLHRAQAEAPHRPVRIVGDLAGIGLSLVTMVGMAGLLFGLHWAVPLVVTAAAVPAVLLRLRHARRLYDWQRKRAADQREAGYLSALMTSRGSAKDLRLSDLGPVLGKRFSGIRTMLRRESIGLAMRRGRADLVTQLLSSGVLFGAYAWLGWLTLQGVTSLGDLVMYAQAIQRAQGAVAGLLGGMAGLFENNMFLAHYFAFLDLKPLLATSATPKPGPAQVTAIRCEGLSFTYPGQQRPVLQGLDLALGCGEMVALVGANGAGKSTLVKLLCRMYDPAAGRILCDGVDIREFEPDAWRRHVSVLFQDASPFEFSARENITFGDPAATDGREQHAAEQAGVHERLTRLSRGYDTLLGRRFEGSEELSSGEWRKLLLARALYKRGEILVLDEPLAFVDPRSGTEILARLRKQTQDRALLIVSHRPAVLAAADRICVLHQGRIAEEGHHQELLAAGGKYKSLLGGHDTP